MQRAKDLRESLFIGWPLLERDEIGIEQRKILVRFEKELPKNFVHRHGRSALGARLGIGEVECEDDLPSLDDFQNNLSMSGATTSRENAFSTMATTPRARTGSRILGSVSVVTITIGVLAVGGFCFR